MEVPLIIGGAEKGSVSFARDGLYTVAEANLEADPGRLVRLWARGGGESAYLGLMQPWSGGLYLRRKLSRCELKGFPSTIECVSDQEAADSAAKDGIRREAAEAQEERNDESLHNNKSCPWPAPVTEETEGLLWLRRPDGSLTAHDGVSGLLALPASMKAAPGRAVLRRIEGKDYLVFRT
jgi:hypothetical protein